jgi:carboxypeptidase T
VKRWQRVSSLILMIVLLGSNLWAMANPVTAETPLPISEISPAGAQPEGDGPWVVRAYYTDRRMVDELAAWLEPWEVHHDKGYLVVAVTGDQYARLLAAGFSLEVDVQLTAELNQPREALPGQVNAIPGYPCYRTVEETYATAQSIVAAHPTLASWTDIGNSWEKVQPGGNPGYDMMVLRLTNSAIPGPKPKFFAMAAIHAREYATAELATRFAEYLVDNYGVDADVTWLLDYHEIHLLLQSNPDGRKHAETGISWRKNTNENYCGVTPNYRGADLNRNYDFQWGCCGGSSGSQCDETYRGPTPASEPETVAVQNYVLAQFPDQREDSLTSPAPADATGVFLDIHSYSELVLWPWGFSYSPAPNSTALQTLGRKFAYWNNYSPEQAVGLYPTDGTTDDFAYGKQGVAAYTFEIGTSFFQDCSTFETVILPDNLPALIYAAKVARTPYLTPAGPEALDVTALPAGVIAGEAVHLATTIDDTHYNNSNGTEPTQNVAAAEYYIDVPPWVTTPTPVSWPLAAVDGAFNQKTEAVEATIDTNGLSLGRHTIFVRGQDANGNWGAISAVFVYILEPGVSPVIEGHVRDAMTNVPLEATVTAGSFQAQTDPGTGFYSMTVISGTYDVSASAAGYVPSTASGIQAQDYQTVDQELTLYAICSAFADDVEAGNVGWTVQLPWAITNEAAHSPTHSWTDSPGGNYSSYRNVSLTSPVLNLSGYQGVSLSFWHTYDLEPSWDYGYVEYSTTGGSTWSPAASYTGYNHTTWTQETVPLPALDGQSNARLRFRFYSDVNTVANGWHIDDIVLSGGGPGCPTPQAPTAEFSSDSPVTLGKPVHLTNLTIGTAPLQYEWDFGDGSGTSTVSDPAYTYLATGTFSVTLVATNTLGSDSVSHEVVVLAGQCAEVTGVNLTLVTTGTIYTGDQVDLSADIAPDDATKPYTYAISAGTPLTSTADPLIFAITFSVPGTHTVEVEVWNCAMTTPVTGSIQIVVMPPLYHAYLPLITKP